MGSQFQVAMATSSPPSYEEGELVWLSVDLNGNLRIGGIPAGGGTPPPPGTSTDALTDTQLRAAPVPVAPSLPTGASTDAALNLIKDVLNSIKSKTDNIDVLISTRTKPTDSQNVTGSVGVSGSVSINNFPSVQAVVGSFFQATQPVSGTFWQATQPVSGPLTDTQLRAAAVPVSGPLTDAQLRATPVSVNGTFFQATQPVSATALPLPAGAATETSLAAAKAVLDLIRAKTDNLDVLLSTRTKPSDTQPVSGVVNPTPATLVQSVKSAAGVALTVTLPVVAGQFHYLTRINIIAYASVARTGAAAPVDVTSTNLPGGLGWTTPTAQAVGTQYETDIQLTNPLKSSVVGTATTIVCPATPSVIWRVNVIYYAAP